MKKIITLLLAIAGMVSTASATDYYVLGATQITNGIGWGDTNNAEAKMLTTDNIHYYYVANNCSLTAASKNDDNTNVYGFQIVSETGTYGEFRGDWNIRVRDTGIYTIIFLFDSSVETASDRVLTPILVKTMSINSTLDDTWNATSSTYTMSHNNGSLKWTKEIPSSSITSDVYYCFFNDGNYYWNASNSNSEGYYWNPWYYEIYPAINETSVGMASTSDGTYENQNNRSNKSFKLEKPTYTYDHITISVEYDAVNYKWVVGNDAYISKTVYAANNYATFGATAPVDLSGVSAKGVTAYTVTANATTKVITKTPKADALAAYEGVLLENLTDADVTLSIPVAASANASSSNSLVAFTGSGKLTQPASGNETYYILTNNGDGVGFYKVNATDGNAMGANTAYLTVTGSNARSFLWFDEATGISETVREATANDRYYNLNGQVVAQPTKGLYIVNGKKVIMK